MSPDGAGSYKGFRHLRRADIEPASESFSDHSLKPIDKFMKGFAKVNCWIKVFSLATFLLGLTATCARADLVINLQNVAIAPGGIGTMDITASSTGSDTLVAFGLELLITPISSTSFLQFSPGIDQPAPPFDSTNYVFAGQSSAEDGGIPFWSDPLVPPTNYGNDTITGGDSADADQGAGYVTVTGTTLLATVQFFIPAGGSGDFQVSLVPMSYDPDNTDFTYFQEDAGGDDLGYTSSGGQVTVESVPEPSSFVMGAIFGVASALWHWCGRRWSKSVPADC